MAGSATEIVDPNTPGQVLAVNSDGSITAKPGWALSYPANAARGGATTLVGTGSASDEFTFAKRSTLIVQNNTAASIQIAWGTGSASTATQGDLTVPAGAEYVSEGTGTWVSVYGVAATTVNGTASGGIVIYGVV